jgi:divalent metal cation (Fe/Co/Zn/Cd) transporter
LYIFQFAAISTCMILRGFGTAACGETAARGRREHEDGPVPAKKENFPVVYATIAFAFVADGISLWRAASQTRQEVRDSGVPLVKHVRQGKDSALKTVLSEDAAAIAGLLIALVGTALAQATGRSAFDGAAAIAVGVLLIVVTILVGRCSGLLIGEAAPHEERESLREVIATRDGVGGVRELLTMYVGPESPLVAERIDLADHLPASDVEALAGQIDCDLRGALRTVAEVFLDPTRRRTRRLGSDGAAASGG